MTRTTKRGIAQQKTVSSFKAPSRGFVSHQMAETWEQAIVSGNGVMGAMVMGRPLDETVILSHAHLYMPWETPLPPVDTAVCLGDLRAMLARGEYQHAADLVVERTKAEGWGAKRWTDPFVPACDVRVVMPECGSVRDYTRSVDFQTGVATVRWSDDRGDMSRRVFVSRPDNVVVMSLTGAKGCVDCDLFLAAHPAREHDYWNAEEKFREGIKDVVAEADGPWLTYRSSFKRTWPGSLQGVEAVARIEVRGGAAAESEDRISVRGATEVVVLIRIDVTREFAKPRIASLKRGVAKLTAGFKTLVQRHAKVHGALFNRVKLDLGGGREHALSSEELIAKSRVGKLSRALLEKEFDAARYNILSATGAMPPNLQGIWAGTWGPPWSADYTTNGNVQCAIASIIPGNMAELMDAYFRYCESQVPEYRENAKRLYGCRGIFLPSRTSSHGLQNHFCATWPMTFWTTGAAWTAFFFYDYYLHTGDREFLRKRALPFMKESALFFEDFLFEGPDGKYVVSPSYSPENNPGNSKSQACINATMDVALIKELLHNLIAACEELKTEGAGVGRWKTMLAKMPDYIINRDGAVQEWTTPKLEDNYAHRHCSHLYPLYSTMPPDIASRPDLRKAFKVAADKRMEIRRKEQGGVMAFGLVQLGLAYTTLCDAEASGDVVDWLANNFWQPNMVTTHDPKSLFNLDLSGGLPAIIIKMLVDSQPGMIHLLPATPKKWGEGTIEGVLLRGGIVLKRLRWSKGGVTAVLRSKTAQKVDIKARAKAEKEVKLPAGKDVMVKFTA